MFLDFPVESSIFNHILQFCSVPEEKSEVCGEDAMFDVTKDLPKSMRERKPNNTSTGQIQGEKYYITINSSITCLYSSELRDLKMLWPSFWGQKITYVLEWSAVTQKVSEGYSGFVNFDDMEYLIGSYWIEILFLKEVSEWYTSRKVCLDLLIDYQRWHGIGLKCKFPKWPQWTLAERF